MMKKMKRTKMVTKEVGMTTKRKRRTKVMLQIRTHLKRLTKTRQMDQRRKEALGL